MHINSDLLYMFFPKKYHKDEKDDLFTYFIAEITIHKIMVMIELYLNNPYFPQNYFLL